LLTLGLNDIIAALGEVSSMPDSRSTGVLKGAINDILKVAHTRGRAPSVREAETDLRALAGLDYDAAVKKHFDRTQLKQMLKEMRKTLPTLNREIYRTTDIRSLAQIAKSLGVVLQAHAFSGSDGAAFRGFYVNEAEVLKRPLIWVNTAAHPAAAAAAFWHEIGHHLTNRIHGTRRQSISLSSGANYRDNLGNPKEVAADIVRVLGGYPQPIAKRLFGRLDGEASSKDADLLVAKAMPHVRSVMGLTFRGQRSPREDLYLLGGLIHTAKLRTTLLSEYGI
jgi:hypothetical protein